MNISKTIEVETASIKYKSIFTNWLKWIIGLTERPPQNILSISVDYS